MKSSESLLLNSKMNMFGAYACLTKLLRVDDNLDAAQFSSELVIRWVKVLQRCDDIGPPGHVSNK